MSLYHRHRRGELSAGGGPYLEPDGGGVTVGDGRDYFGASPSGASGESDEGERTSAGGDGDSVDLGGGEASAGGVGKIREGKSLLMDMVRKHPVGVLT
ncbi:hypothetical protein TB2_032647 [Malus domestica]